MGEKDIEIKEEKKATVKKEVKTEVKAEAKVDNKKDEKFKKVDVKKDTVKKDKKANKKGWIVPTVLAVIVLLIITVLTIMIVTSTDPKKSADALFTDLKAGDFQNAESFLVDPEESGSVNLINKNLNDETNVLFFDRLEWKVTKVTEDNDEAKIEIEISNKDFEKIVTNIIHKTVKAVFNGEDVTENESRNYLVEELKNDQVEMTTTVKTINAKKVDKKWRIVKDSTLVDALLPGLQQYLNI